MPWAPTFGEVGVGGHLLYEDSYGRLCIAQNQGDAAESLGLERGRDGADLAAGSGRQAAE